MAMPNMQVVVFDGVSTTRAFLSYGERADTLRRACNEARGLSDVRVTVYTVRPHEPGYRCRGLWPVELCGDEIRSLLSAGLHVRAA